MGAPPPTKTCRACGTEFAAPSNGVGPLCLGCLFDSALCAEPDANGQSSQDSPVPPTGENPLSEGRFANYEISTREDGSFVELGRGGMGVTYRARDTTLHCEVALKVVNPARAGDVRSRARFLREARAAAGLRHPHVASVFFFGERPSDHQLFYVMELVEGETLHARISRCGGLPADHVLQIGAQVAEALLAAEARGLTHRDLKPANLMLVEGDAIQVKLIDFGLARALAEEGPDGMKLTRTQEFVGTPVFSSPEQFNVWQEVGTSSDFYALGATLWFALTGQPPFIGRTPREIYEQQIHGVLPLERLTAARVPVPVVELLRSLLSPDPAGRPQTARALLAALEVCRQPTDQSKPRQNGKYRHVMPLLAAVAGLLLLVVGWWTSVRYNADDIRKNALLQRQTLAQQQQLDAMQQQLRQQSQLIAMVNAKIDRSTAAGSDPTSNDPATAAQAEIARDRGISVETLQRQLADEQVDVRRLLVQIDQRLMAAAAQTQQWQELKRTALTRLGEGEYAAGHYADAVVPYQQALALADARRQPLVWCDAARDLELALWQLGRYAEAIDLARQIVDRRTALQGPEHPATLREMEQQAVLLHARNDLLASETLYRQVLAAQERTLGAEAPDTLVTLKDLSNLLHFRSRDAEAELLGRRCLEAAERTLGRDNALALSSANNLAVTLYYRGHYEEALSLDRRCVEAHERLQGPDHPDTLKSLNNLAADLEKQGKWSEAEPIYRRVLAAEERLLGPRHPLTLSLVNNLAVLLQSKEDYTAAEPLLRRCLEAREHVLGPDHNDTLLTLSNLAQCLDSEGNASAAEPLYLQAEAAMTRLLPPQDDGRMDLEHYFSLFREKQGRLTEALTLAAQVAEACKTMPVDSPLRCTYEQHLRELQVKVHAETLPKAAR